MALTSQILGSSNEIAQAGYLLSLCETQLSAEDRSFRELSDFQHVAIIHKRDAELCYDL